jgi:amino acid transporter
MYPLSKSLISDWREVSFQSFLVPGAAGRFFGFWACCCQAIYAYVGTEVIGIAADETERQRETLPKAVRRVSYRIMFYYVGAVFVLGLNVSALDPLLKSSLSDPNGSYESPFVLMVRRAGIPGLAHVINAVALIASLSVANANLYASVSNFVMVLMVESCTVCSCKGRSSS